MSLHESYDRKARARLFVESCPDQFRPDFLEWLDANFAIWLEFERQADLMRARGRAHYSARTIIEWIRHSTSLTENSAEGWKFSNNWCADLARLWMLHDKSREGFFERRIMPGARRAA